MGRNDPGVHTLIVLISIILVTTAATVTVIKAAGSADAGTNDKGIQKSTGKSLVVDTIYLIYDTNRAADTYMRATAIWMKVRVPKHGSPVDLRKTTLVIKRGHTITRAKYVDADGDNVFENDACGTANPFSATDTKNPGDVNYGALEGNRYTAVWIKCQGKYDDYIVYPDQTAQIIYRVPEGLKKGEHLMVTIDVAGGDKHTYEITVPDAEKKMVSVIPLKVRG